MPEIDVEKVAKLAYHYISTVTVANAEDVSGDYVPSA